MIGPKHIRVRVISMKGKVQDKSFRAPGGLGFTPKGINDCLEEVKALIRRKHSGVKFAVARVSEVDFVFAPTCVLNEQNFPNALIKAGEARQTSVGVDVVRIRIVMPDGREQRKDFHAPPNKSFERSGIQRVLDTVVEWAKSNHPMTNFVVFEEAAGEFAFIPEQAVDAKALRQALKAAMN